MFKAFLALALLTPLCVASPVVVNFDSALVEIVGATPLPILLSGSPNNLRLRFHVPGAGAIQSLNSLSINVSVYDDGDGPANELGELVFVFQNVARSNLVMQTFGSGVNGTNSGSPLVVTASLAGADLADALTEIQDDGYFLVRVNRNGGDFFVGSGEVAMDAETVPEPATGLLATVAMAALLCRRRGSGN